MKISITIFVWLSLLPTMIAQAQKSEERTQIKYYNIQVLLLDSKEPIMGYLNSVTDTSITIIPTNHKYQILEGTSSLEIPVHRIKKIKKFVRNAALYGALTGFVLAGTGGVIIGVAYANSFGDDVAPAALGFGIVLGAAGAGIGAALGSIKKVYRIRGDLEIYRTKYFLALKDKALIKN